MPDGVTAELTTVADDEVVIFDEGVAHRFDGLPPDTDHELLGMNVHTLPSPGELLSTVATTNDVHFGETICGVIEGSDVGPTFEVGPGEEPYPEVMNRGAISEIQALDPDAMVVKGDLTASGTRAEFDRFREFYEPAFGDRLTYMRGNHDSYHGEVFADFATQEVVVDGAILAVIDTSRIRQINGSISAEQIEWLDELAARADRPVLVFGHHNIWNARHDERTDSFFGVMPSDSEALVATFERRPSLVGYFAGHTHRNLRQRVSDRTAAPFVEVSCVKDYPGAWAEYRIYDGGILQVFRRIATPDALAWTEKTRGMYEGAYGEFALGRLKDRNFLIDTGAFG